MTRGAGTHAQYHLIFPDVRVNVALALSSPALLLSRTKASTGGKTASATCSQRTVENSGIAGSRADAFPTL